MGCGSFICRLTSAVETKLTPSKSLEERVGWVSCEIVFCFLWVFFKGGEG